MTQSRLLSIPHADCPCLCHLDALVACDSPTCAAINYYRAEDVAAFQAECDHQMIAGAGCVRCGKGRPDPMWQAEKDECPCHEARRP